MPKHLTIFLLAALVYSTDKLPCTVFIIEALVAVLVFATDKLPGASSFFSAGNFADALSFI